MTEEASAPSEHPDKLALRIFRERLEYLDERTMRSPLCSALASRRPPPGCTHHTDCGCRDASETYRKALDEEGLRCSMSAIANRCHNGQPESFKAEDVYIVGSESFLDLAERAKVICTQPFGERMPKEFETQHTRKAA